MKTQVVVIHGGDTFGTYEEYISFLKNKEVDLAYFTKKGWKDFLAEKLGNKFEVIAPQMPNKKNAKYLEWKIWFEKLIPFLNDEVIFVGHSLGGIFLPKYLAENAFPKKIRATFLVAAPFDSTDADYTLADFTLPESLKKFEEQGGAIYFYQSKDDPVVPYADVEKYKEQLPNAQYVIFENRGHFNQEEFPEIVQEIQNS